MHMSEGDNPALLVPPGYKHCQFLLELCANLY
jgi:hypothetical protein